MGSQASKYQNTNRNALALGIGRICCPNKNKGLEGGEADESGQPDGVAETDEAGEKEETSQTSVPDQKTARGSSFGRKDDEAKRWSDGLPNPVVNILSATANASAESFADIPLQGQKSDEGGLIKQSSRPDTDPRTLAQAFAEDPLTSEDVALLTSVFKKTTNTPVDTIVEEHMRMQASHETASPSLVNEKSSKKRVESLSLVYDVLSSFGLDYHMAAFKQYDLPKMDQWAFFMFMIGQSARKKNHPLEIYLDVMEATRHVLEKKLKKKGQAMSNAFHRMEGAFLLWAKEGYEWNGDLVGELSVTAFPDLNANKESNERVRRLQKKLQDLTPTGSAESNSRVRNSTSKPTRNTAATRNNQNLNEDVDDSYGRKRSSKSRQLKRESSAHAGGDYSVTATSSSKRASVTPGSIPVVREYSRGTAAQKSEKTTRRGSNESWKSDGVTTINVPNPFPAEYGDGSKETEIKDSPKALKTKVSKAKDSSPAAKKRFGFGFKKKDKENAKNKK